MTVRSFPSLDPHSVEFIFEGFPSEYALLKDLLESIVAFEFLLTRVFLILLHVIMQVDLYAGTMHSLPDVVKTEVHSILKECLIDG